MPFIGAVVCCCHGEKCSAHSRDPVRSVPQERLDSSWKIDKSDWRQPSRSLTDYPSRSDSTRTSHIISESRTNNKDFSQCVSDNPCDIPSSAHEFSKKLPLCDVNDLDHGCSLNLYLGAMSASRAERKVLTRTDFKLYHKVPRLSSLEDLHSKLQLYIVYKTSSGSYRHYPVVSCTGNESCCHYYVMHNSSEDECPTFENVDKLVRYYQTFLIMRINSVGQACFDTFPC